MPIFKEVAPKRFKRVEKISPEEPIEDIDHTLLKDKMKGINIQFSHYLIMYIVASVATILLLKFAFVIL
jgi:hypothetical protein